MHACVLRLSSMLTIVQGCVAESTQKSNQNATRHSSCRFHQIVNQRSDRQWTRMGVFHRALPEWLVALLSSVIMPSVRPASMGAVAFPRFNGVFACTQVLEWRSCERQWQTSKDRSPSGPRRPGQEAERERSRGPSTPRHHRTCLQPPPRPISPARATTCPVSPSLPSFPRRAQTLDMSPSHLQARAPPVCALVRASPSIIECKPPRHDTLWLDLSPRASLRSGRHSVSPSPSHRQHIHIAILCHSFPRRCC